MSKMMDAMAWFHRQFGADIAAAIAGTPFTIELITAIAMQETYSLWGVLYRKLPADEVLALCVGDTLDSPDRKAFPRTKADLLGAPNGEAMFAIARRALEDVGAHHAAYRKVAQLHPAKFCHGFGIFQYDLQHFRTNPDFFLQRQWGSFPACLELCVSGLKAALKRVYGGRKNVLSDEEQVYVAIAYNRGRVDFRKKFKQGFRDAEGTYYGEWIWAYLKAARGMGGGGQAALAGRDY